MADPSLTVSLEPHLVERLRAVLPALPVDKDLHARLSVISDDPVPSSITYSLLVDLSRWARTPAGSAALRSASLDESDYSMIALLAGTRSAPEKHFPMPAGGWPTPAELREQEARREGSDRRALATVVNALVSIGGASVAVWYAAGVAGWKSEWRVLLAFLTAFVVAIAEAGIYIIYTTYNTPPEVVQRRRALAERKASKRKEEDDDEVTTDQDSISTAVLETETLRKRRPVPT